ncbi:MAG: MEKHLA domain-containing protein [Sulfuricaulis sp.]|uniref:PAS domain S-box protein n=1 Tax=Sulfuricaulis sp. TaxID=2003553 RepID=UPI0025DDC892|nr:PAS domain S-box protein [Sulfuricaulis sp.]MCR4345777.1 MEKHLA domain-containing protein [Sulfuricaulis sp.]
MSPHSSDIILREIAQAISMASGEEFFRHLVAALCQTLEADFAFIGRLDADDPNRIHVMAVCVRGEIGQNFSYQLHGTPCENVVGREPCHYPRDIRNLFPEDHMLVEMGIESYIGHPLFGSAQQPLGLLAVMHSQAMPDEEPVKSVLRICTSRAAAEIERIQAEEMLRASETNLRSLAENADEGILVNRAGRHVFANRRIAEMLGYRIDELLQTTIKDIVHPDEQERVTELFRKRMTGHHVPNQYETVFVAKDGKRVPMEISAAATVWQGKPAGLVFLRDITERKQAEAETRKLSSAIEQTADSVIITDRDGIIQYVNPAYEETTGFSREETLGKKSNIVKSGKHEPAFYQHLWETVRSGQTFRDVFINRRKNGELFYEQKTITPLKDENGNITHFVSTGKDITAHVLAENENRRMQTFLNSVVENLPNMLFVKDAKDLRFVRFNKAAEELLGYSRDEMLGKSDYDFFTKEEADFFTAKDKQVLNSGQFHDVPEESIHTRHKGVRILHTKKIPILDEAGKPLYLLGISEDITDRKKTEDTVLRLGRILDKSSNEIYVINAETLRFVQVN